MENCAKRKVKKKTKLKGTKYGKSEMNGKGVGRS